jgi:hypothetical protein
MPATNNGALLLIVTPPDVDGDNEMVPLGVEITIEDEALKTTLEVPKLVPM